MRSGSVQPCRPSSFRFATLFRRGGCGFPLAAVWLAWRLVANGETSGSKKSMLLQASQPFFLTACVSPAKRCMDN